MSLDPTPLPETTPPSAPTVEKSKRPAYLGWLTAYLVIFVGILLVLQLFNLRNLVESGVELDVSPTLLLISIIFLGVLGISAGAGLWWGQKWGWWLSALYFFYALSRALETLINPVSTGVESTRSWLSAGLSILVYIIVLIYLYSHEILAHFHLEKFPRWISLLILLIAAVIFTIVL